MTVKLVGVTPGHDRITDLAEDVADLEDALAARFEKIEERIDAIFASQVRLIERVEKIEAVNAVAHELPPAKKVKS